MLADPHPQGAALRVRENHEWTQETANKSRSTQRLQRGNAQGFLCLLCALPPPLGVVLPELRRGSPTSLRQGYGGPPKLQRRRKRLRREGGCGEMAHFSTRFRRLRHFRLGPARSA